ncbi:MAG TPA: TIM-barrel domain-containing protein [Ktedonobacteraceae bacterium]
MFTAAQQGHYFGKEAQEHIWLNGEQAETSTCLFAGSLLGNEIVRVRFLHTAYPEGLRFQLVDNVEGTLPYHSWIVSAGDEAWQTALSEEQQQARLTAYLRGFAYGDRQLRWTGPLAGDAHAYGFGEHTRGMNKRGEHLTLWNWDPDMGHGPETDKMYTAIPFYLTVARETGQATGLLVDHTGQVEIDVGHAALDEVQITVRGDSLVLYFLAGPTPADVLRQYTDLTGRIPLPPLWALGHHQGRWSYYTEQEVRAIGEQFRTRNHPCESLWLDIDHMDGFRTYTWNTQSFPDVAGMTSDMLEQGFHIIPVINPGIKSDRAYSVYREGLMQGYLCRRQGGDLYMGTAWPDDCNFADFSRGQVREWWGNHFHDFLAQGVAGSWNDMNEPSQATLIEKKYHKPALKTFADDVMHIASGENITGPDGPSILHPFFHNAYGMQMARAMREGTQRFAPDQRPFVLTRSGTAGVQRYAAMWTGDNSSWWEHIPLAMRMCLSLSMSGLPFVGANIGGFWEHCNGELLVRFAQLGAFLPLCWNHNAVKDAPQEPWAFGEPYESAYRSAIEQRYRLLPYLYNLFHEASRNGSPVIRPLFYHYAQDPAVYAVEDAYLVGEALLTAPVHVEGATSRAVYLPEGTWVQYWDGQCFAGGQTHEIAAPLEQWPLFVRANSILPTCPVMQYTGQRPADPLTFTCYMTEEAGQADYTLYEDDANSMAYQRGAYGQTSIHCQLSVDGATVTLEEAHENYQPAREWYEIIVLSGAQTFKQRIRAGQGKVTIELSQSTDA